MRADDLMQTGECFPDYDPFQHLQTILEMLQLLERWRKTFTDRVEKAKANGDGDGYAEACFEGGYADVGYCHSAVAALAPMFEGIFTHEFRVLRAIYGKSTPAGVHRRCKQPVDEFWNPKVYVNKAGDRPRQDNIQQGSVQILKALGVMDKFPPILVKATDALFTYRNQSLHNGYEWPTERRERFKNLIHERGWAGWFSWATTQSSGEPKEPWIAYMTDSFIRDCFNLAGECVVIFETIRQEEFAKLPQNPPPDYIAALGKLGLDSAQEWPVFQPVRWTT